MSDKLVVTTEERLELLIENVMERVLTKKEHQSPEKSQDHPIIYHTREQVRHLLHTTYPTLQKYTDSGLLNATYFGRKVLYRDDELNLALPRIRTIQAKRKKKQLVA